MTIALPDALVEDIVHGRVNLFLGAGSSFGSTTSAGGNIPQSAELISMIASHFGLSFDTDDKLPDVTGYLNTKGLSSDLRSLLQSIYLGSNPSDALLSLLSSYWPKIYSTNIDDAVGNALSKNNRPYSSFILRDHLVDFNLPDRNTFLIYLHGHSSAIDRGIVFSRQEYIDTQIDITPWYDQLANDVFMSRFIYCGTKLDEPVFDYIFEKKRRMFPPSTAQGYLITPNLSIAKSAILEANGITHVPGTIADLAEWVSTKFPKPLSAEEVLEARYPELFTLGKLGKSDIASLLARLKDVTVVSELRRSQGSASALRVREFYRGTKPTWDELIDGVPAHLSHYGKLTQAVDDLLSSKNRALVVLGPAGSGKTTALRTASLGFSKRPELTTLVLDTSFPNFEDTVRAIAQVMTGPTLLFFDGVDNVSRDLSDIIENKKYENMKFVLSERKNIWNERTSSQVRSGYSVFNIDRITEEDARAIRDKLEAFGPFSKLARLQKPEQVARIYDRSQRQLLIGMLEATNEKGFENIIRSDFASVKDEELRFLIVLVALSTIHRMGLPTQLAYAAFASKFGSYPKGHHFNSLAGIIVMARNELVARHPLYSQVLLEQIVDAAYVGDALQQLLLAFAKYGTPVPIRARALAPLFVRLVRHRFVNAVLHNKRDAVIGLYENIEKAFTSDGHFYLQFGLAYRAFGEHDDAMARIQTSARIYDSFNARHALAKQRIIMACQMTSKLLAEPLFEQAKLELEALDRSDRDVGMYPLVTLAEGHIDFASIFLGRDQSAVIADKYSAQIARKLSKDPGNERLKRCRDKINYFKKEGKISILEPDDVV